MKIKPNWQLNIAEYVTFFSRIPLDIFYFPIISLLGDFGTLYLLLFHCNEFLQLVNSYSACTSADFYFFVAFNTWLLNMVYPSLFSTAQGSFVPTHGWRGYSECLDVNIETIFRCCIWTYLSPKIPRVIALLQENVFWHISQLSFLQYLRNLCNNSPFPKLDLDTASWLEEPLITARWNQRGIAERGKHDIVKNHIAQLTRYIALMRILKIILIWRRKLATFVTDLEDDSGKL